MVQLTTQFDSYIKGLIRRLEMLWTVKLNDGTVVFSDYDRYVLDPFSRMVNYCGENGLYPVEVKSMMFGAPEITMAKNDEGLDGLFILRGVIKDIDINSAENSISYKKLVVGTLNKDSNKIDVKKFCWPENEIDSNIETRELTLDNLEMMYFKNGEEKNERKCLLLPNNG